MTEISNVEQLAEALNSSTGFFVGITLFDGRGLFHAFLTKDFPQNDLLRSLARVKGLVVEELEKPYIAQTLQKPNLTSNTIDIKPEDIINGPETNS